LPGHIVAARSLFRADRRPATKLTARNSRAAVFQFLASAAADAVKIENVANLDQAGRSKRLDGCRRQRRQADYAVAVHVLMESGLHRFQRGAASRPDGYNIRVVLAPAISTLFPYTTLFRSLPGHIVAARSLFRADRRPATKL